MAFASRCGCPSHGVKGASATFEPATPDTTFPVIDDYTEIIGVAATQWAAAGGSRAAFRVLAQNIFLSQLLVHDDGGDAQMQMGAADGIVAATRSNPALPPGEVIVANSIIRDVGRWGVIALQVDTKSEVINSTLTNCHLPTPMCPTRTPPTPSSCLRARALSSSFPTRPSIRSHLSR